MNTATRRASRPAFPRVELVVVAVLIAIAIVVIMNYAAAYTRKSTQIKALDNARGIALALRLYAEDNGGSYPSVINHNGLSTAIPVTDSNTLFAQLFPAYINDESVFWLKGSAFCSPGPPDEIADNPPLDIPVKTLKAGENEWAYVVGLNNASNPEVPLIADGFADVKQHTYTTDVTRRGGVWQGRKALVIRSDNSGMILDVDQDDMTIHRPNGGAAPGDIFTTANGGNGWLTPANTVVNPK